MKDKSAYTKRARLGSPTSTRTDAQRPSRGLPNGTAGTTITQELRSRLKTLAGARRYLSTLRGADSQVSHRVGNKEYCLAVSLLILVLVGEQLIGNLKLMRLSMFTRLKVLIAF